jgi:hypothetical protein
MAAVATPYLRVAIDTLTVRTGIGGLASHTDIDPKCALTPNLPEFVL